ncbi:glutaredoxin family protein [Alcanivorax sp. S6407]|uniref:glutaredoxin family protein n=1 Tax=Alcanivorax sp. S6407 TaxID=2926424 RepID=UPI001FF21D6D|nr:glutaredoxin family protein [Alcanivorax sp. S6407]MCK0154388.1 glutaredoxin family protein [Alcanivorax sp. S6407]
MKVLLSLLLVCLCAGAWSSGIYRWVDDQGKVHFSDQAPQDQAAESLDLQINTFESVTYESLGKYTIERPSKKQVIMYSASWCGVCDKAKRYFERKGIPYTEYDVETSQQGKQGFRQLNGKGVPIILVGNRRMNGFTVSGFERLYQ